MCGIFGIHSHPQAANLAYLGLHALQHRGQESCGIVTSDGAQLHAHKSMGLVADCFTNAVIAKLPGSMAIGHSRYSTTGSSSLKNAQPFLISYAGGHLAIAHNGNLTNANVLRKQLEARGSIFQSSMDSEVIMHLIAAQSSAKPLPERIAAALTQVEGAYSLLFISETEMIAVRDPHGFRPLVLGALDDSTLIASETIAFDLVKAKFVREVHPGEMIIVNADGMRSVQFIPPSARRAECVFEQIYFARPDSHIFGGDVYQVRVAFGAELACEHAIAADVVCPIPDSGTPAAIGYAHASGVPFQMGLIRSHYIGRTFIEPEQAIRDFGVKLKLNPVREVMRGKRVVLVDDSIMRGTTSAKIVRMVRDAGAAEVHVRISAPPTRWPCFYGVDIPTREELIASSHDVAAIQIIIGADSLGYLSVDGMYRATGDPSGANHCDACFSGRYDLNVQDAPAMMALAKSQQNPA